MTVTSMTQQELEQEVIFLKGRVARLEAMLRHIIQGTNGTALAHELDETLVDNLANHDPAPDTQEQEDTPTQDIVGQEQTPNRQLTEDEVYELLKAKGVYAELPSEADVYIQEWLSLPEEEKEAHIRFMRSLVLDPPLSQIIIENLRPPLTEDESYALLKAQGVSSESTPEAIASAERWHSLTEEEKKAVQWELDHLPPGPMASDIVIENRR